MSTELKPWYAIATPHEDIREGRLAEAVFAATCGRSSRGRRRRSTSQGFVSGRNGQKLTHPTFGNCPTSRH